MKRTVTAVAATLTLGTSAAFAGGGFEDYARVTYVTPEYDKVNVPREECYSDVVPQARPQRGSGIVGPLLGGVAGGLLGSRVGEGNGKVAAAAVGAAVGALVGNHLSSRDRYDDYGTRDVRRCRVVDSWENRLAGYRVSYEYQGHAYTTVLPYDPGPRLPVRVDVIPSGGGPRADDWTH